MTKIKQTTEEIRKQLDDQIELLKILSEQFDDGALVVAKSMATSLRVILHNTSKSHGLIHQLEMFEKHFFNTCNKPSVAEVLSGSTGYHLTGNITSESKLFCIEIHDGGTNYTPYLDEIPGIRDKEYDMYSSYENYWNQVVITDVHDRAFTRKELILAIANKDGGAHVDPELDEKYVELSRNNSLGWESSSNGVIHDPPEGAAIAAVRQIAHEIIKTFDAEYPKRKMAVNTKSETLIIGGSGMTMMSKKPEDMPPELKNKKVRVVKWKPMKKEELLDTIKERYKNFSED